MRDDSRHGYRFEEDVLGLESEFAKMRDSMHILSVMNQYSTRVTTGGRAAEKLLRIALFSNSLQLSAEADEERRSLVMRRRKLARGLKRGSSAGRGPRLYLYHVVFIFARDIYPKCIWPIGSKSHCA